MRELAEIVGDDVAFEVAMYHPGPGEPDMGLYGTLAGILREADPEGAVIPVILPATTDARFFARLNIQCYGFTPMKLPPDINVLQLVHAADERIPVDALEFGCAAMHQAIQRYGA